MSNVSTARARSAQAAGAAAGRFRLVMASLALLLAVTAVASLCLGRYSLTGTEVMAVLLPDGWLSVETNRMMENIVLNVRLPRVLLAIIAGAGLAMSGAAFQALFANPLAAPDTLGVATGASFGAVLGILWGWNGMGIQLMSLATGLSAVFFVIVINRVRNTSSILMIILSGMVVGALFSALVSLVKYAADPQDVLPSITFWMMGALTGATKSSVLAGTPMVLLGMLVLWLLRWRLNVTTLPTDEAASLGIPVRRIRAGVIIAATMITASVVSMCGLTHGLRCEQPLRAARLDGHGRPLHARDRHRRAHRHAERDSRLDPHGRRGCAVLHLSSAPHGRHLGVAPCPLK